MKFAIKNENDEFNLKLIKFKEETTKYAKVTHFAYKLKIANFTLFLNSNDWKHAQIITNDFLPEKSNKKFSSNIEIFPNEKDDGLSVLVCFENFENCDFKVIYRLSLLDGSGNVHFSKVNCNIARKTGKFSWENNIDLDFILNAENQVLINNVLNIFCEMVIVEDYSEIDLNHVDLLDGFYYDQDQFHIVPVVRNYFNAKPKVIESLKHKWTIANVSNLFDDKTNWGVNQIQSEKFCSTTNDKIFYFSLILCKKEKGNIEIYLRSFTDENGELNIRFKFSLIEDQIYKVGQDIFTQNKNTWGFEDFVSIQNLLERASILNDSIKIICEIKILDENQSQIGEPNQSLSESFSNAKFRVIKSLAYKWTIDNFRQFYNQNQQNQRKFESNKFSLNDDLQFQLRLYPNGKDQKHRNSLSLFLRHFSKEKVNLNVWFKISILNENSEKKHFRDRQRKFRGTNDYWGFVDFVSVAKLLDQTNGLLFDDKLIINCEIQILEDANSRCKSVKNLSNQLSESYLNVCPKLGEITIKSSAASTTPVSETLASKTSDPIASNLVALNEPIETALRQINQSCDEIKFCKYAHRWTIKNLNINDLADSSKTFKSEYFSPPNSPDVEFRLKIRIFRIGLKNYIRIFLDIDKKSFTKFSFRFNYTIIGPDGEQTILKDEHKIGVIWLWRNITHRELQSKFLGESNTLTLQLKIASIETSIVTELQEEEIKVYLDELNKLDLNEDEITFTVTNAIKEDKSFLFSGPFKFQIPPTFQFQIKPPLLELSKFQFQFPKMPVLPKTLPPNWLPSVKSNSFQSKNASKILASTESTKDSIKFGKCAHRWTIENLDMNDFLNSNKIFNSEKFSPSNSIDVNFQLKIYILNKRNDSISVYLCVDKKINAKLTYRYNYSIIDADGKATFLKDEHSTSVTICLNKNLSHEEFESKFLRGSTTLILQLKIVSIEETSETKLSETEIIESLDKLYKLDLNKNEITCTVTKEGKGTNKNSLLLNTEKTLLSSSLPNANKLPETASKTLVSTATNLIQIANQQTNRSYNSINIKNSSKFAHRWTIENLNIKDFLDSGKIFESKYFSATTAAKSIYIKFRLELNICRQTLKDCVSIYLKVDKEKNSYFYYRYSCTIVDAYEKHTVLKDEQCLNIPYDDYFDRICLGKEMSHKEFESKFLHDSKTLNLYLKVVSIKETTETELSETEIKKSLDQLYKLDLSDDEITYTVTNGSKEDKFKYGTESLSSNLNGKSVSLMDMIGLNKSANGTIEIEIKTSKESVGFKFISEPKLNLQFSSLNTNHGDEQETTFRFTAAPPFDFSTDYKMQKKRLEIKSNRMAMLLKHDVIMGRKVLDLYK